MKRASKRWRRMVKETDQQQLIALLERQERGDPPVDDLPIFSPRVAKAEREHPAPVSMRAPGRVARREPPAHPVKDKPGPDERQEWKELVPHLRALFEAGKLADLSAARHAAKDWLRELRKQHWPEARSTTAFSGIARIGSSDRH